MGRNLNKKLLLISIKYSSWIIGIGYLLQCLLTCVNIQVPILTLLFGCPILPIMVLLQCSYQFGFCIWHRLPLYNAIVNNIINIVDYYIGIPISSKWMLLSYLIILTLFALIGMYIKNKNNVETRIVKESTL